MESRLRIAGQAVHPVLVMFPLGLFVIAVLFDVAHLSGAPAIVGALAYWNVIAGLAGGVLAAMAGAVDLMFVPNGTPAKRAGVLLGVLNMGVLVVFAVVVMVRMADADRVAGGGLLLVEVLAVAVAGVSAWFGSDLSHRGLSSRTAAPAFARPPAGHRSY
jgi:uncharacterized membrane protein